MLHTANLKYHCIQRGTAYRITVPFLMPAACHCRSFVSVKIGFYNFYMGILYLKRVESAIVFIKSQKNF